MNHSFSVLQHGYCLADQTLNLVNCNAYGCIHILFISVRQKVLSFCMLFLC